MSHASPAPGAPSAAEEAAQHRPDARTLRAFYENKRQRILLDYLIERAANREMTDEERLQMSATYVERLRENALRSQKERRRRG